MSTSPADNPFEQSPRRRRYLLPASLVAGAAAVALAVGLSSGGKEKPKVAPVKQCDPAAQVTDIKNHIISGKKFTPNVLVSKNKTMYVKAFESTDTPEQTKFSIDPIVVKCGAKVVKIYPFEGNSIINFAPCKLLAAFILP